ncbi:hypothetical protein OEW28_12720 [Defluviimonas sp. WL0002]|uniref:Sulfotransferase family protein n=1 Tax=Albidovulum marisflavi TaxID=2984159 RepID=A0ABT2ZEB8_9RHOB|nr:hypothetical protein [Defluviimonas sp. WL0002]MCV2869490.1 hypothetical protein [Defluviimonas sp. WL0002]
MIFSPYVHLRVRQTLGEFRRLGKPKVQVIGERCSGTNFTEALIMQNLPVRDGREFGWKHGFPSFLAVPDDVVFVAVYREVFGWLLSMYEKPWHAEPDLCDLPFSDFIRAEWRSVVDKKFLLATDDPLNCQILQQDRHPLTGKPPINLLELRRWKMQALQGLSERGIKVVHWTHDRIVADPGGVVTDVARLHGLPEPEQVTVPKGRFGWPWNRFADTPERKVKTISDADRAFILENLDLDLERQVGFSYPDSTSRDAKTE